MSFNIDFTRTLKTNNRLATSVLNNLPKSAVITWYNERHLTLGPGHASELTLVVDLRGLGKGVHGVALEREKIKI